MSLPEPYRGDLCRFHAFVTAVLTPQEERVLQLVAFEGLQHKHVSMQIGRSVKTIERILTAIGQKYRSYYSVSEREMPTRKIQAQAACYYYLKDLV